MEKLTVKLLKDTPVFVLGREIGTAMGGEYVVKDTGGEWFEIVEGPHAGVELPKNTCRVIDMKEYSIEYVTGLETKLADAGRKLSEKERLIKKANRRLGDIVSAITKARDEFGRDFVINSEFPVTAIENMIYRIRSLNKENEELSQSNTRIDAANESYRSDLRCIGGNLHDFLCSLGIVHQEDDVIGMSEKLRIAAQLHHKTPGDVHKILDDILSRYGITATASLRDKVKLLSDNVRGNRPVEVPSKVAKALDKMNDNFASGLGYSVVQMYEHFGWDAVSRFCSNVMHSDIKAVADWRDSNLNSFRNIPIYGYVGVQSERERKIEEIKEIFYEAVGNDKAAELIYDLFNDPKPVEVVDDGN